MFKKKILAALILSLVIGTQTSFAINKYSVKIDQADQISKFEFTADGKEPLENSLLIGNIEAENTVTLKITGLDAITNNLGGIFFKNSEETQNKLGSWIEISEPQITLKPLEQKSVNFKINLPDKITPGIYIGGISVEDVTPVTETALSENFSAKVKTRLIKKIYLSIPGEKVSKYELSDFRFNQRRDKTNFSFDIINQGNTLLSAKGNITITDSSSKQTFSIPINASGLLQESTFNGVFDWGNHSKWGNYEANLTLDVLEYDPFTETFTKINSVSKELNFTLSDYVSLTPYFIALALLLLVILGFIVEHYVYLSKCTPYIVGENETIKTIADKFQMSWQKLAKINKIKAPYEVHAGDKILVRVKNK